MSTEQENNQPVAVEIVQPVEPLPVVEPVVEPAKVPVVSADQNLEGLILAINNMIGTEQINSVNILTICINLMQLVEKYPKLPGKQKKDLVLRALQSAITNKGGDQALMALIPSFIDSAINIENGKVQISFSPQNCCVGCFGNAQN